jgi:primosomal protein N''
MAEIAKTTRQLLAADERRLIASEISATIRQLDHADRRAAADKDVVPYLASAILQLDVVKKALAAWRPKHAEPADRYLIEEHRVLQAQVDADFVKLGAVGWARKVVRRIAAEKAQVEQRKAVRATFKASGKCRRCGKKSDTLNAVGGICHRCFLASQVVRSKKPAAKAKASRAGLCSACRKQVAYLTTSGVCTPCLEKMLPRIARRK